MSLALFTCSIVIIFCIIAHKLSDKVGVPTLLLFILLGMLFGSDGIIKINFENYPIAEQICSITLIFIMFYGGFGTNWKMAKPVAPQAFLLASLGVAMTAGLVGLFCHYILGFPFLESMLIGSVISSTDAASVFSIFRSKNLNLKHGLASLLELESGSNDPTAYMLTVIILGLMSGTGNQSIPYMLFAQVIFGIIVGTSIAVFSMYILEHNNFSENGMELMKEVVGPRHAWIGKNLKEIDLPPNSLVIMIERGDNTVIPQGKTRIKEGDIIVFNCEKYTKSANFPLSKLVITETHP